LLLCAPLLPLFPYTTLFRSLTSPSKTNSAGPVISNSFVCSFQKISKSPPRRCTKTRRPVRPVRMQATATAQAPVPQAQVSPEPRSEEHTSELQSRFDLVCRL